MESIVTTVSLELVLTKSSCCSSCPGEAAFGVCKTLQEEASKHKNLLEGQSSCGGSFTWSPKESA